MTTATQGDTDQSSRVAALEALYAAERQDGVNVLNATLAMLAAVVTYTVAILAFGSAVPQSTILAHRAFARMGGHLRSVDDLGTSCDTC